MLEDLVRASVLTEELWKPLQYRKWLLKTSLEDAIHDLFFISSPFERVFKGESYEEVEKDVKKQIEEFAEVHGWKIED